MLRKLLKQFLRPVSHHGSQEHLFEVALGEDRLWWPHSLLLKWLYFLQSLVKGRKAKNDFENISGNPMANWIKPKLLIMILYNRTPTYFATNPTSYHLLSHTLKFFDSSQMWYTLLMPPDHWKCSLSCLKHNFHLFPKGSRKGKFPQYQTNFEYLTW